MSIVIEDLDVVDTFQIFSGVEVPATVSFDITFTPNGRLRVLHPSGDSLQPTYVAGAVRDVLAEGYFSASSLTEPGGEPYSFENAYASSAPAWAEMGLTRNGSFLNGGRRAAPDDDDARLEEMEQGIFRLLQAR